MTDRHTRLIAPHTFTRRKPAQLDRDKNIPLGEDLAKFFVAQINQKFLSSDAIALLHPKRALQLAHIITYEPLFPFKAIVKDGAVFVEPALDKISGKPVLKDISDGVTRINLQLAADAALGEHAKFILASLFQAPIAATYHAAGMSEGAHTKYTSRAC